MDHQAQEYAINCKYDKAFEQAIADLIALCLAHGVEAHTKIKGGSLIIVKRRPRRSRVTGAAR